MGVYEHVKRILDVILSAVLLFFLLLPLGLICLMIVLDSPGGVLFCQRRIGQGGREFVCYKLRTMYRDTPRDCPTSSFLDADRYVTRVGRFLRRTSLDELPQLWNVLRGEMSLVGPRPLIPAEGEIHRLRQRCQVYRVKPGMTGLSQVRGRDRLSDREKARLDSRYVHTVSLSADCKILWQTVWQAWRGEDVFHFYQK